MSRHYLLNRLISKPYYPWLVWGIAASAFLIDYLARVAPGVMVDQLMRDLHVQALALASLSACFYYSYIGMQLPVGLLVDRFSPASLSALMLLVSAAGCVLFACATRIEGAAVGRLLTGLGAAFAFVAALKLASLWFPPSKLGLLAGLTQALGMLGAAAGQAPMAMLVSYTGWRISLIWIASLMLLLGLLMASVVRDRPYRQPIWPLASTHTVWTGLLTILSKSQSWQNALFAGLLYAPTSAIAELWGVKFFRQAYNLSNEMAAFAVGLIFIGWTLGGPLLGWLSDGLQQRKGILLFSASLSLLFISCVLFLPRLPVSLLCILLFAYGMSNAGVAISYAVATELHPYTLSGTSLAFTNMLSILIGACSQPLIGWLLDLRGQGILQQGIPIYSTQDFRIALMILPLCLLLAMLLAIQIKESYCQTQS